MTPELAEASNETPQERFKDVATKKTKGVLKAMDQLAMLGSSRYQYTDEQLDIIFKVLEAKMKEVRTHLDFAQNSSSDFSL
jgi:hypothetical protein